MGERRSREAKLKKELLPRWRRDKINELNKPFLGVTASFLWQEK